MHGMLTLSAHLFFAPAAFGMVSLLPHGGAYRPPPPPPPVPPLPTYELPPQISGDTGKGGKTTTPSRPGAPTTPTTPGQASPPTGGQRQAPRLPQGGITIGIDGSTWTYWWEYNKSAFLLPRLLEAEARTDTLTGDALMGRGLRKEKRQSRRPGPADAKRIADALRTQLFAKDSDYQMRSSCLLSLAKTGHTNLRDMAPHLADAHPVVRESAILSMGIAGLGEDELHSLFVGDAESARLCGGQRPGYRERSFAGYALGLLASRSGDMEIKRRVLATMIDRVGDKRERMDVRIAALHAIRTLDLPGRAKEVRKQQLAALQRLALDETVSNPGLIQVQALTALRGPLASQGLARERLERKLAKRLLSGKDSAVIRQSMAQTLGFVSDSDDLDVTKALMETVLRDKDELARRYAMMALGRIGGELAQDFLLAGIHARRARNAEYAWLALALATSCQAVQPDGTLAYSDPRPGIGEAIHARFKKLNSRMPSAGLAIALGLLRHEAAVKDIEQRLTRWQKQDEPAGYLALALGLMGNTASTDRITSMLENARHREILVVQASLALSLLGDTNAEAILRSMLETRQTTPVLSALAMGMGRLGTRASMDTMIHRLSSQEGSSTSRAFMAVALGELLIQNRLRWNASLSWGVHYRYSPATLTGNNGVLDLL